LKQKAICNKVKPQIHINTTLGQAVFKVAASRLETSVKTSYPKYRVIHSLVKLVPRRHNALTQYLQGKLRTVKVIFEQIVSGIIRTTNSYFCTEITFSCKAIL